jgi:hypothetical protein
MEESKTMTIIFAVERNCSLTEADIREYIGNSDIHMETVSSPKGWKINLPTEIALQFLEKGSDTLNGNIVNFAEDDPFCTIYIKGISEGISEKELSSAMTFVRDADKTTADESATDSQKAAPKV